jgi:hypothetical protein
MQPLQFADSSNIKIIGNMAYFSFNGKSYLERLKNGLTLEYVFEMEDGIIIEENNKNIVNEEIIKQLQPNSYRYKLYDEKYDYSINLHSRKGKKNNKKIYSKNTKKNKIRQNGYSDKLYFIESNLPSVYNANFDLQYYPYDFNESINNLYDNLYDNYSRDYYEDYYDDYSIITYNSNNSYNYDNFYDPPEYY